MTEFVIGDEKYYPNNPEDCEHDDIDWDEYGNGECKMCGTSVGEFREVNTSYDQDQPIGDTPSDYPAVGGEPIDAETGQDFYDIQMGGQAPRIGEYENVWEKLGYEANDNHDPNTGQFTGNDSDKVDSIVDSQINRDINKTVNKIYSAPKSQIGQADKVKEREEDIRQGIPLKGTHERAQYDKIIDHIGIIDGPEHVDDIIRYAQGIGVNDDDYYRIWRSVGGRYEEEIAMDEGDESLNKDGTGIARATRGVNPNKAKHKVLKFEYVSNSDCPICKEFDGKTFAIDSPNRPVIPRLESQGKKGGRPYTHPNCKCKWVNVFSESKSTEVDKATLNRARKWYGGDFDQLTLLEQKVVVVDMFKSILGIEASAKEFDFIDPVPFASMAKLVFDAIKPTIQDKLGLVNEGGRGSGKNGHQKWMLGAEVGEECENCMVITEFEDGICMICGN